MKKWIHASSQQTMIHNINVAKKALEHYTDEQVAYVKECQDEIGRDLADHYSEEDHITAISEIKRDYLVGAIEDDLMTEDEFNDIFALLDIVGIEDASAYA